MSKVKMKKVLSGISIASLIAGMTLGVVGCKQDKSSCGKGSCGSKTSQMEEKAGSSCGQSSCSSSKAEEANSSCGKGSCGK